VNGSIFGDQLGLLRGHPLKVTFMRDFGPLQAAARGPHGVTPHAQES
jgi:hypothetical protein